MAPSHGSFLVGDPGLTVFEAVPTATATVLPLMNLVLATAQQSAGVYVNRVAALAEPSEILVSQTVKDLVAGSGLPFRDRGSRALNGVEGSWRLYAVAENSPA